MFFCGSRQRLDRTSSKAKGFQISAIWIHSKVMKRPLESDLSLRYPGCFIGSCKAHPGLLKPYRVALRLMSFRAGERKPHDANETRSPILLYKRIFFLYYIIGTRRERTTSCGLHGSTIDGLSFAHQSRPYELDGCCATHCCRSAAFAHNGQI